MFIEYGQNVNKHHISQNKAILGKMGGVYVTYVADFDKGQWHVVTLVWAFHSSKLSVDVCLSVFACLFVFSGVSYLTSRLLQKQEAAESDMKISDMSSGYFTFMFHFILSFKLNADWTMFKQDVTDSVSHDW